MAAEVLSKGAASSCKRPGVCLEGCAMRPDAWTGERLVAGAVARRFWDCGMPLREAMSLARDEGVSRVLGSVGGVLLSAGTVAASGPVCVAAASSFSSDGSSETSSSFVVVLFLVNSSRALTIPASFWWCSSRSKSMRRA